MSDAVPENERERSALSSAIDLCRQAKAPDRQLDVDIARAVFPSLADLHVLEIGVWRHGDGTRVRALRYSASASAARTLVPAGCWIEQSGRQVRVCGARSEWVEAHPVEALAICAAALSARLGEKQSARARRLVIEGGEAGAEIS
jgi:hypothetical protein